MTYRDLITTIYNSNQSETSKVRMMLTATHPYSTFKWGKESNSHKDYEYPYGCPIPFVMYCGDFAVRRYVTENHICYSGHFHECHFKNITFDELYQIIINETMIDIYSIHDYNELKERLQLLKKRL